MGDSTGLGKNFKWKVTGAVVISIVGMSLATPPFFKAIMNKKLDEKVAQLQKEGYQISLIEDKSGYLTTDKIYRVALAVTPDIRLVEKVEVKFYNLPATNVEMIGKVEKVEGNIPPEVASLLEQQGKIELITPNFQYFTYRIYPVKGDQFYFSGSKGTLYYQNGTLKQEGTISQIWYKSGDGLFSFTGLHLKSELTPDSRSNWINGSFNYKVGQATFQIAHFNFSQLATRRGEIYNGEAKLVGNSVSISSPHTSLYANQAQLWLKAKNLYLSGEQLEDPIQLLSQLDRRGFEIEGGGEIDSLKYNDQQLGRATLALSISSKPVQNLFMTLASLDFSPFKIKLTYKGSPAITQLIFHPYHHFANLFKREGNYLVMDFSFDGPNYTVSLNGKSYTPTQLMEELELPFNQ